MQSDILVKLYLTEHTAIANNFPISEVAKLVDTIKETYDLQGSVYVFGNGGGASTAEHLASDLSIHPFVSEDKSQTTTGKNRLQVYCLSSSSDLITRLGNDIGFNNIFIEQLKSFNLNAKDTVIAFSTSGNSPNIVQALAYARVKKATTVLIGGRNGGKAKPISDICILIPGHSQFPGQVGANDNCFHIEDFQTSVAHMITGLLKEELGAGT